MRLVGLPKYGPLHRFHDYHVYRTLFILSDCRRRGRKLLADAVGVGEGSIRTIINYLRDKGLVEVKQSGVVITSDGLRFLRELPIRMARLEPTYLSMGESAVAVLVRKAAGSVGTGIEQRDTAIKAGAKGATTVVVKGEQLILPPGYFLDRERPELVSMLKDSFDLREGDVVIIGTGTDYLQAENGALAAALDLL